MHCRKQKHNSIVWQGLRNLNSVSKELTTRDLEQGLLFFGMVSSYFNHGGTKFFVFPFIRHLLFRVDTHCNNHNRKETDESNRRWQSRTSDYFMDEEQDGACSQECPG